MIRGLLFIAQSLLAAASLTCISPGHTSTGEPYSLKADVYSFGVILWEILHRARPFNDLNAWAIAYQVGMQGRRLPIPYVDPGMGQVPPIVSHMITECWKPQAERPMFETLLQVLQPMQAAVEGEAAPGLASVPVPSTSGTEEPGPEPEPEPESEPEVEEGVPTQLRAPPDLDGNGYASPRPGVHLRAPPPLELVPSPAPVPQHPIHYAVDEVHYIAETVDEFIELLTEASIDEETLVWQEGMADWEALGQCLEVRKVLGLLADHSVEAGSADSGQQKPTTVAVETVAASTLVAGGESYDF